MKHTLVAAALAAALAATAAAPSMAASPMSMPKMGDMPDKCTFLPLLPDCMSAAHPMAAKTAKTAAKTDAKAAGFHVQFIPFAWWTCQPADAKAGHLLNCASS